MKYKIKHTIEINSDFIDSIKANSECYFNVSDLTDSDIVSALQKMDNPKYRVTKSLKRLLDDSYDSDDTNNCVQIALYDEVIYG